MTSIYRGMDRAALDAAYDNTAAVADSQAYRARWWETSAGIRAEPRSRLDLRYGTRPRAILDYFPSGAAKAPLFVFIHGGYWQRNEKERFAFVASGPRARYRRGRSWIYARARRALAGDRLGNPAGADVPR
jgi:arylformamidase